ncbi:hypothetical protein Hden_2439 [Hyphomicrobium denitrificans ATCC 51888]|uniref:Transmembrane protein n=1 Tax=Hyphomicrobium denitrificans (strain ATCC 51888 / DSM 1869 / NCIMB 11706 / TK 0415) TaxID=582899 RepID=D8JSE2_HYPDA|nr:hypothetical protein [Hyphomicrobium denitrificans]ADJ24236.1 hypothetical protein Hden_2439 [Hyphomicrobium denitrificans ATCC 51888]
MSSDVRARGGSRTRIGLVVVQGVGDTEPGYCVNALLDTLAATRPGYSVLPANEFNRIAEPGVEDPAPVFPVIRRGGRHTSGVDIEAVEVHLADLAAMGSSRVDTMLGLFRVIFESHHLVDAMLSRSLGLMAVVVRTILWFAAWLLRGPIAALTVATSLICGVYLYEPKWLGIDRFDAGLQFIVVQTALCAAGLYLGYRIVKGQDYSWYDAAFWLVFTSAALVALAANGALIPLTDLFPPLKVRGAQIAMETSNCLPSDPLAACYVNGLYRVIIYGWRFWGALILVATLLLLTALGGKRRSGDPSRLAALSTSVGILIMQFLLWTTIVVTIIYTMLTRAETGSSLQAVRDAVLSAVREKRIAVDNPILPYLQVPDLKLEWIARFKFIYAAAALTVMAFLLGAWLLMKIRRYRARTGLDDLEHTSRTMPRLLFNPWLVALLIGSFVIVLTFVFFQPEMESSHAFISFRSFVLPLAAVAALLVPLSFGHRVANVIQIARDLIDHNYRPTLEAAMFFIPARFRPASERPRRARIQERLKLVLKTFVQHQGYDGVIFLAHSQGSIVAYDYLRDNGPVYPELGDAAPALLTFGSPLGTIYQKYFHEYAASHPVPHGIAARLKCWINLYRVDDYIGGRVIAPSGLRVDNHVMGPGGHTGYWTEPDVAEALDAILTGKVADATKPPPLPPLLASPSASYAVRAMRNA